MGTKADIFKEMSERVPSCVLCRQKQVFKDKNMIFFPPPDQVFVVPKPKQTISTETREVPT